MRSYLGKGLVTKGFVNQIEFRFNLTFNKNLLKCSEERIYKILFTFLNNYFHCVENVSCRGQEWN